MTDLKDALQPLLDQPPAEPEPLAALEARSRRRHRRRRIQLTTAVASAAAAIAIAVGALWPSGDDASRVDTVGRGEAEPPAGAEPDDTIRRDAEETFREQDSEPRSRPVVVAKGANDGVPWQLRASGTGPGLCVELVGGGSACGFDLNESAVGLSVGGVSDGPEGTENMKLLNAFGPVRRDVARIEFRLASGDVVETSPVGQDAGFGVNFYVWFAPPGGLADAIVEVIAYDSAGNELDRDEPVCPMPSGNDCPRLPGDDG